MTGKTESVDRAVTVLAQVNLVHIGLEYFLLGVVHFQQLGHDHFRELAAQGALGRQEKILHQLLGQGAAALQAGATQGCHQGARHAAGIDAMMGIELPVFDRNQALDQNRRHLVQFHQRAILVVRRIDAADQQGVEPRKRDRFVRLEVSEAP